MTPIYHNNVSQFQHIAPGRAQRGGYRQKKKQGATDARAKHAQVAAPDFWTQQNEKGQLELPKLIPKWNTKAPQTQSKNNTTNNVETKDVSSAKCD